MFEAGDKDERINVPTRHPSHKPTHNRIACAKPLALACALSTIFTAPIDARTPIPLSAGRPAGASTHQPHSPQTWIVQNCSDAADNSLRDIIQNPAKAQSGDTVDLSQLPELCAAAHSTISLTTGEITMAQNALKLTGPEPSQGSVTVSAGGVSRVLKHAGMGPVEIRHLTISNGYVHLPNDAYGGCLDAGQGSSLYLYGTTITNCRLVSDSGYAKGGAVRAGSTSMVQSTISGNKASAPGIHALGGGMHVNSLSASYSSISNNVAEGGLSSGSLGGGAYVSAGLTLFTSTIDHNRASYGGGLEVGATSILVNSTLSDNVADLFAAALYLRGGSGLSIWNSTIASNQTNNDTPYGAVLFVGLDPASTLDIRSSIVANNAVGPNQASNDVFVWPGMGVLTGAASLVTMSNVSDPAVIVSAENPKLGPLQSNGGPTWTRLPAPDSPARNIGLDMGNPHEQRGSHYPRSTGASTDIGAVQFDTIFGSGFE